MSWGGTAIKGARSRRAGYRQYILTAPRMIVLALETATRDGSVALARDGRVLASARGDGGLPARDPVAGRRAGAAGAGWPDPARRRRLCGLPGPRGVHGPARRHRGRAGARLCHRPAHRRHLCAGRAGRCCAGRRRRHRPSPACGWMRRAGEVFAARYVAGSRRGARREINWRPCLGAPGRGRRGMGRRRPPRCPSGSATACCGIANTSVPSRSWSRRRCWRRWSRGSARWPPRQGRPAPLTRCDRSTSGRRTRSWRGRGRRGADAPRRAARGAHARERRLGASARRAVVCSCAHTLGGR